MMYFGRVFYGDMWNSNWCKYGKEGEVEMEWVSTTRKRIKLKQEGKGTRLETRDEEVPGIGKMNIKEQSTSSMNF